MTKSLYPFFTLIFFLFTSNFQVLTAQEQSDTLQPILIDKAALSGLGLTKRTLKDQPGRAFFQKNIYRGKELSVYIVSSQSWKGRMDNFSIDEYIYMFNGKARVKPDNEADRFFQTGDYFYATKGFTGDWEIMAGDNYHYELSVITTERAPEAKISKKQRPSLIPKDKLSGIDIELSKDGQFEEEIFKGDELKITLKGEKPASQIISQPSSEKLISLLSGKITITDSKNRNHTFYSGDFFLLPLNFKGQWKVEGHGLIKYLVVEKAK